LKGGDSVGLGIFGEKNNLNDAREELLKEVEKNDKKDK